MVMLRDACVDACLCSAEGGDFVHDVVWRFGAQVFSTNALDFPGARIILQLGVSLPAC